MPKTLQVYTRDAIKALDALADYHDISASEADAMDHAPSVRWHDARRNEVRACIATLTAALRNESPPEAASATEASSEDGIR